jgi:hypothetical protein
MATTHITKNHELQLLLRMYKTETGESDLDMHKVALYLEQRGIKLPQQPTPLEILERQLAQAARTEYRDDKVTGRPYRVNHAMAEGQKTFWFDIDDPDTTRTKMRISLISRREQMIGDGLQLTLDADHWNSIHPTEEPIQIPLDFTEDVNERKAV